MKRNVRAEAARRDKETGQARLKNMEFLGVLTQWIEFSASLPADFEFSTFCRSALQRMKGSTARTVFDEGGMACYLEENILQTEGSLITSSRRYGLSCGPLGLSGYAPNSIEVSHRVLKGLLDSGYQKRGVGSLIIKEVCEAMVTRLGKGDYANLLSTVSEPWPDLLHASRKSARLGDEPGETEKAGVLRAVMPSSVGSGDKA